MTRRLVTALVLLFSSLFLCIFSVKYVIKEIENNIEIILSDEDISEKSQLLIDGWQKNRRIFAVFLKHTDADFIEQKYLELERACKSNSFTAADEILGELYSYLLVTKEAEKLRVENIF